MIIPRNLEIFVPYEYSSPFFFPSDLDNRVVIPYRTIINKKLVATDYQMLIVFMHEFSDYIFEVNSKEVKKIKTMK
jgi:hypothetical protein